MSIYLDEKNPGKHPPFDDASPDIVEYVRYLEVIAGKSANTAFSYYCDLRGFSRFMKRRRGLVPTDTEIKDIDPKGLDTAFWGSVSKEDIYEYLYFLNRECGNKKSSTARRLASLHGFYDYLVNQVNKLTENPTASIKPPKQDKVLPKYLTAEQSMDLLESTQYQSDFPERDYCMVVLFLNCGMRLSELVGMDLGDIDLEQRQIRLFGKGHKERMVYLNEACVEALQLYLAKRNTMEGLNPKEKAVFVTRRRKERISNRRVEQLVTGAMKAAGLKGFSTHKLRHTAATLMYQTGNVDILTLKQLLGHSSVGTTQIYTHLQEFQVRAAIEQNPLGTVTPEKARLDTTKRAAGENRGENNADSMDVEEAASSRTSISSLIKSSRPVSLWVSDEEPILITILFLSFNFSLIFMYFPSLVHFHIILYYTIFVYKSRRGFWCILAGIILQKIIKLISGFNLLSQQHFTLQLFWQGFQRNVGIFKNLILRIFVYNDISLLNLKLIACVFCRSFLLTENHLVCAVRMKLEGLLLQNPILIMFQNKGLVFIIDSGYGNLLLCRGICFF